MNLDGSWNARLAKHSILRQLLKITGFATKSQLGIPWSRNILFHDVREPLPFPDNSFYLIYASHLLEHLYVEEAKRLLRECFRILAPNGILRMVVPDLRAIAKEYLHGERIGGSTNDKDKANPADRLNIRLRMRCAQEPSGNIIFKLYTALKDFHSHKWMYDAFSLCQYFNLAGFVNVSERAFRKSQIPDIEKVEQAERVLNNEGICVEGNKPGA